MLDNLRALIVSDAHSNLEALGSVVEYAKNRGGFDEIWSLGDLVGDGPDPQRVLRCSSPVDSRTDIHRRRGLVGESAAQDRDRGFYDGTR